MNILYLAESWPYPLIDRSRLRNYYLLRTLVEQGHQVTLVSFTGESTRPEHIAHLADWLPNQHTIPNPATGRNWWAGLFSNRPVGMQHGQGAALEAVLARLMAEQRFDLVFAAQANMSRYAQAAQKAARDADVPRLILDIHRVPFLVADQEAVQSGGMNQFLWRREAQRYRHTLLSILPRAAHTLVMTAAEKGTLLHLLPHAQAAAWGERVHVLPLGIDELAFDRITDAPAGPQILFMPEGNTPAGRQGLAWFLAQVLPLIRRQVPDVQLTLLARHREWFSAEVQMVDRADEAVTIQEFISDLHPFWAQSRVFVVPLLREDGLQSGIVQSWLRGVPVVSTPAGVIGLSVRPGQNILVAEDPAGFAAAVAELLARPETADGLARNARHWVARHYDYHTLYAEINTVLTNE